MRLSQSQCVSSKQSRGEGLRNLRTRKKHKRLDAICDKAYIQNRGIEADSTVGNIAAESESVEAEPRRSSRPHKPPTVFDASPRPSKKLKKSTMNRERFNNHVDSHSNGYHSPDVSSGVNKIVNWKTRLRSRVKNENFRDKTLESQSGTRKHFDNLEIVEEEPFLRGRVLEGRKRVIDPGTSAITCSRMPRRIKATNVSLQEKKELKVDISRDQDGEKGGIVETTEYRDVEDPMVLEIVACGGNESEVDGNIKQLDVKDDGDVRTDVVLVCIDNGKNIENTNKEPEELDGAKEGVNESISVATIGCNPNELEIRGSCDSRSASSVELQKGPEEDDKIHKIEMTTRDFVERLSKSQIKEGRKCGLCGGANDGKPPKRVVERIGESEKEAHTDSVLEEPSYNKLDEFGDEPGWLGRLLGPLNDRFGIAGTWVHQYCAVWSPEVYFSGLGCLKNIRAALYRGRGLKCSRCDRSGATIGCRVDRCPKTYHLPCARANGCHFDQHKFLIACTDHRNLFQPHGNEYNDRIKKLKLRKLKLELKKAANDRGRKDYEAEEKWLENCGVDGEFLKRESKRLDRDILRIAPVYIGGSSNSRTEKLFQGWESVAGLQSVVQSLKEVVILPLLYPEFFDNHGLTPPRGVLLHGYPGTGKTLVVRALIGSCDLGDKRIAYFARKGADCLGKYVGDAERQLRLLFQVAEKSQPSIIFFDEIDGLAPCRTRQQDQTHNSVVSTLLALLDGLKSRGSVVVIGATNRPEAVDPALRRPGRFDREIYFPLPSVNDRAAILSLHTQSWPKPVSGSFLKWIATKTAGFAGADLQALCTQAAMVALKRNCPLKQILNSAEKRAPNTKRCPLPSFLVEERDWLVAMECCPLPCSRREVGMSANDVVSAPLPAHLLPCLIRPFSILLVSLYLDDRICLPPRLSKAAGSIKELIFSLLEKRKLGHICWWSHVQDMLGEADVAKDIEKCILAFAEEAKFCVSDPSNGDTDDICMFENFRMNQGSFSSSLHNMALSLPLMKNSGLRILIAGNPKSGQRHVASFLFHYLFGDFEIHKIDLITISQEGRGDIVRGITQILMRCTSMQTSVVFMPRVDLWAIQMGVNIDGSHSCSSDPHLSSRENSSKSEHYQVSKRDKKTLKLTDTADCDDPAFIASHAWNIFVQQIESICLSTSLIFLATSDVPCQQLPPRVSQFFKSGMLCTPQAFPRDPPPPFFLQIDGRFDHDMVIDSSATRLSKDIVRFFVQMLHHTTHNAAVDSCEEYKICDIIDGDANRLIKEDPPAKPVTLLNRSVKEKSSWSAIVTFGYQILKYPQFAELCWVTSKLKDGPCADTNGPWRDWPFNACVVRPAGENCSIKNKEKSFSLVRGLVAVGLVACRGGFALLSEVSSEVQKVLDLLVGQIDEKIKSGKDRHQFIRILSQAAYLKDLVHSWAYTLQSLETVPNVHSRIAEKVDPEIAVESLHSDGDCISRDQAATDLESDSMDGVFGNHAEDKASRISGDPEATCSYNCCTGCLHALHDSMRSLLIRENETNGKDWTVDTVHDTIAALSSAIISQVRKHFLESHKGMIEHEAEDGCECNESRNGDANLRFLFRNGIPVAANPDESIPFHCKIDALCLCRLVEQISRTKTPSA